MYYPFVASYLPSFSPSSRCDRDVIIFKSLVNDFDCIESFRTVKKIFGLGGNIKKPFNDILFVFNDSNNIIFGNDKFSFVSDGRLYNLKRVHELTLHCRFYKFLLRLIHDADKAFGSMDMCLTFLHDYSAGATPADLWSKYCWYRVFGNILNESCDVFHDTNF